jgi:hypothetical protein
MGNQVSAQQSNFLEQTKKFYTNKQQAYSVDLWQNGENDSMIFNETKVPKGVLPYDHEHGGKPVFQHSVQESWETVRVKTPEDNGTLVMKTSGSHSVMAFMPAGFRDAETPNKINPFREDIGNPDGTSPQKCASSLCHVVTIPVDICRYNIITCSEEDFDLLNEMDRIGKLACLKLRDGPDDMVGSLRWHLKQDSTITLKNGTVVNTKLLSSDFADSTVFDQCQVNGIETIKHLFEESMVTTFHVGESASVGYLHSHTRPTCFDLKSRVNMDRMAEDNGYIKDTTLSDCIKFIQSSEYKQIKINIEEDDTVDEEVISRNVSELDVNDSDEEDDETTLCRQNSVLSR